MSRSKAVAAQNVLRWGLKCFGERHSAADGVSGRLSELVSGASGTMPVMMPARGLAHSTASTSMTAAAAVGQRRAAAAPGLLANYKQLSKFKLSSLVVLTAGAGFVAGSGDTIDWVKFAWTSLGTFGAAACANTLNQMYEVANDRCMSRTCNRPLPAGRMGLPHAAAFAASMAVMGIGVLYTQTNELTAALGALNIALYAGVYTPLKQMSPINTWVGAVVGAIPPLMGWASATGATSLDAPSSILAAALFFWQMPHFMALAWMCKDDYLRGGFRMLSGIDPTGKRTAWVAVRNCLYLAPIGLAAYAVGLTTEPFVWESAALAGWMGMYAAKFAAAPSQQTARSLFKTSLLYLPLLLAGLFVHRLPQGATAPAPAPVPLAAAATVDEAAAAVSSSSSGLSTGLLPSPAELRAQAQGAADVASALFTTVSTGAGVVVDFYTTVFDRIVCWSLGYKCPSRVHGDSGEDLKKEGEEQEQQQQAEAEAGSPAAEQQRKPEQQ